MYRQYKPKTNPHSDDLLILLYIYIYIYSIYKIYTILSTKKKLGLDVSRALHSPGTSTANRYYNHNRRPFFFVSVNTRCCSLSLSLHCSKCVYSLNVNDSQPPTVFCFSFVFYCEYTRYQSNRAEQHYAARVIRQKKTPKCIIYHHHHHHRSQG